MADKHPRVQGPGALVQVVARFRKLFPVTGNASTPKKLGFAGSAGSKHMDLARSRHRKKEERGKQLAEQAVPPVAEDSESDIDGCDVAVEVATSDEDLPATEGGVA